MNLKAYLSSLERGGAADFAKKLGVSASYLSQLASGRSNISLSRCVEIEKFSSGLVSRKDLRPNDWHQIWPELVVQAGSQGEQLP